MREKYIITQEVSFKHRSRILLENFALWEQLQYQIAPREVKAVTSVGVDKDTDVHVISKVFLISLEGMPDWQKNNFSTRTIWSVEKLSNSWFLYVFNNFGDLFKTKSVNQVYFIT